MSVKYNRMTRRQFLIGTGGYFLVVPFLPSLLSREALAQVASNPKRMILATMGHCMMATQVPNPNWATQVLAAGIRETRLSTLSQTLAPFLNNATMTSLKSQGLITLVRGLDNIVTPDGHGETWLTGSVNHEYDGIFAPSLDAYLETSQTLYPSATSSGYLKKILRCNGSHSHRKVGSQVTRITDCYDEDANNSWNGARKLYNDMIGRFSTGGNPPPAQPPNDNAFKNSILTRVFESYQSTRNNRRISNNDRLKLEEHMERVHELQTSLVISPPTPPPQASCNNPFSNTTQVNNASVSYADRMDVYLKLIQIAITCGMTKVATISFDGHGAYDIGENKTRFPSNSNHDFHGSIIHNDEGAYNMSQRETHYNYWMKWHIDKLTQHVIAPLHATEDVETNNGKSYLENMLVGVLTEGGVHTDPGSHINLDYMPMLFGNMNGIIKSDRLVVFDRGTEGRGTGIPYNQLLITLLQAMGLSESEYSAGSSTGRGFGAYPTSGRHYQKWFSRFYSPITEIWNG